MPRRRAPSDELPPRVPPTTRAARLPDRPFSKGRPRTPVFALINSGFYRHGFLLALRNSERAESASYSYDYHIYAKLSNTTAKPRKTASGTGYKRRLATEQPHEKLLAVLTDGCTGDTEDHENSTIQSHDALIGKPAHIAADPRLSNRRDFVRH